MQNKSSRLLNNNLSDLEWEIIFSISFRIDIIQFRINHRILATNSFLHNIKKVDSYKCSFCEKEIESTEHFLGNVNLYKVYRHVASFLKGGGAGSSQKSWQANKQKPSNFCEWLLNITKCVCRTFSVRDFTFQNTFIR